MDSGNSSSMQSSSGGDDQEYDSRSFFPNITPPPPAPPPPPPVNNPQLLFSPPDHHPGYLQAFSDRDLFTWPPPSLLRSDPTHPNPNQSINYLSFSGEFSAPAADATVAAAPQQQQPQPSPPPAPPGPKAQNPGPSKNPKKRTRASRRAPTTVLTTDTTNFRAMVQEFTGIPDPPFSAAASVYSRRLDLLGSAGSSMRLAAALGGGGGGLLRPTAQRLPASNNVIQEVISQSGSGQPDPMLAFQTLLQQPHHQQLGYQPQPQPLSSNHNATFGINIGLLGSENHLSNTIGLESSPGNLLRMNSHHHQQLGGSTGNNDNNNSNNNNYVMSCGAMTSSSSTDLIQLQGEYRNQ